MEKTGVRFVNMFKNNDVFPGFVVWINQTIQEPLKVKQSLASQEA